MKIVLLYRILSAADRNLLTWPIDQTTDLHGTKNVETLHTHSKNCTIRTIGSLRLWPALLPFLLLSPSPPSLYSMFGNLVRHLTGYVLLPSTCSTAFKYVYPVHSLLVVYFESYGKKKKPIPAGPVSVCPSVHYSRNITVPHWCTFYPSSALHQTHNITLTVEMVKETLKIQNAVLNKM
ncbi:hypothetical protein XELAEV_18007050mg [Xenopus laevis]|uniref:Uncharacterized protein n=1 Tax=Xenopus laevis TaxID=8355 RepID=A0A974DZR0_XENLA|nr:hypothetical protein XELAEV_18007050mg [Xenopus laevis]